MVNNGVDVRTRFVDRPMNESLRVSLSARRVDRSAVERERHQIVDLDTLRCARTRHDVVIGGSGIPYADVPEGIDNALARENPVRGDKLFVDMPDWRPSE